jgi:amino acid adenylation domain-containing protein
MAPGRPTLTYGHLRRQVQEGISTLNRLGFGRHDRIALVLPNGPEMAVAFLSVAAGAIAAPLNPAYRAQEFDFYLADLNIQALVVQTGIDSPAVAAAQARGIRVIELVPELEASAGVFTLSGSGQSRAAHPGPARADDLALLLHTSGTTSRPKIVPLTQGNLCVSAHSIRRSLELTAADRCLNVMPLFHIHGLIGALLSSLAAGASVVCTPGFYAPQFFPWIQELCPTWYTAVPTMHQSVLARASAHPEVVARHSLRFIRSCSSPLSPQLMAELEGLFGAPVIEAYGMCEASHQIASNPLPPRHRKPGSVGVAAGPEIAILDELGNLRPAGETGEIAIRGANVTRAYENRPEANEAAFTNGWFRTGDQGALDSEGYLTISGRLKEIINRGGEKISPREVDEVLLEHPAVAQAVAFALPDPRLGEEVAAAVVLREAASSTPREIRQFAAARLADFKVPRQVLIVSEIPKGPTGKPQRIGLAERLGIGAPTEDEAPRQREGAAPHTPLEENLARIWTEVLSLERVGIHDDFLELVGDSVLAARLISRVRGAMGAEVPLLSLFEEASTIAGMAALIETLPQQEQCFPLSRLSSGPPEKELPLSFAQERFWFLHQLDPASTAYNRCCAIRLSGLLEEGVLQQSLEEVLKRHEALRTTVPSVEGQPLQVIAPAQPLPLPVVDLRELPEDEREARAVQIAREAAGRPFDLEKGPVVRASLVRLRDDECLFLLITHYIAFDGWSAGVLIRELGALYEAFAGGMPSPLPELPLQYADFARWQRQRLQGDLLETQLAYWKQQLAAAPAVLALPTDHSRPSVLAGPCARQTFLLPPSLAAALTSLGRQEHATLFMTLLAAFQTLLSRYTGQEDLCVGAPAADRRYTGTEQLIGCLVNTLVLRADLTGDPSFRELLRRLRRTALEAYAHQDLPFERLVEALRPERDPSRNPLVQVMFQMRSAPGPTLSTPGLKMEEIRVECGSSPFDLSMEIVEQANGLSCLLEYNPTLFDAAAMGRMAGHFRRLLEGIAANPEQRLSALPLLTDAERRQLLVEWSQTQIDYPHDQCLHQLFEAQVARTPEAVAVVFEAEQLTYAVLNARANQLAHHLQGLGVGPEVRVGICVERSLEMVVGLLGILKAGGAYVPLDPAYPEERLALILEDTAVPVLLTQWRQATRLEGARPERSPRVVCLVSDWDAIAQASSENPTGGVSAGNLAYVIYTSGSTGRPKGCMIPHRGICNRLLWMQEAYPLTEADRVLQKTPFSFDVSLWEFFWPLLAGARLVIARPGGHRDSAYLVRLIADQKITTLHFVPSMLQAFLEDPGLEACDCLRRVICSGEELTPALPARFYSRLNADLYNLYGPTEASVDVTAWHCEQYSNRPLVPIGRPIANAQIYLLDRSLNPVPIGASGELHIGGVSLARGYLHQPGLTAGKFVPDPFSGEPGARLYRTGDLARFLPDGNLEFLGRCDDQVKVRGVRIEQGEIEAVLGQHATVRECVVVAREDRSGATPGAGDKRLIAYIVPRAGQSVNASELRRFLVERLPEYMLPSAFVTLESLPLTPNGKVDRRALPIPELTRPDLVETYAAPRTPVEELLAEIWAAVLGLDQVGVHDDFFELGGHSLLATRVVSRVRSALQVDLPLQALFEAPTVASLAARIGTDHQELGRMAPPPRPSSREGALPLSFAQQRLWFIDQMDPGRGVYNIPVVLRLSGRLDVAALEQSLAGIVRRHEALRTSFPAVEGQPQQQIATHLKLPLTIVDLPLRSTGEPEAEVRRLATQEAQQPFDLATGPLLRVTLLRLGAEEHVLLLTLHHIVADGWSLSVLFREWGLLYQAFAAGQPSPLAELSIQYADFAVWQRQWLRGDALEAQLSYWRQQLAGAPPILELPTDFPRPPVQSFHGAYQFLSVSPGLTAALKQLSQQEGVTLFMTLLAAFQALLFRYTGQSDIVVGSPIANRNRIEIEGLIGFFANTLVLRCGLSGNPSFRELLGRVRQVALGAYAHQDLPYEKLVEEFQPERSLSHTPFFQVFFALQNAPGSELQLPGVTVSALEIDPGLVKSDLGLSLTETEQGLAGSLAYSTDLFEPETMARLLGHFRRLLEGIVADPEQRLSHLPLLTDAECQELLVQWNQTRVEYPRDACVHTLFEAQVARTPEAVALVWEEQFLTYRELNARANQLARYLRELGVGPEVRVGICVERSLEMMIGLLAILKAGGAYVPLDPSHPRERLAFLLQETQARLLLSQQRLAERLPEHPVQCIYLEAEGPPLRPEDEPNLASSTTAESLAYVIYTSGSTGQPKGVGIPHRGVIRLVKGADYASLTADAVFLQLAPLAFDASTFEIWGALLNGARLVLFPPHTPSLSELGEFLQEQRVTTLWLTAGLFHQMIELHPEGLRGVRQLLAGSEALSVPHVRQALEILEGCHLINGYGPTESTTFACCHRIGALDAAARTVPIGRPIANTQAYVLDDALQPVPIGVAGELYLGGDGLARGYLGQPAVTAEKFVPHPYSDLRGARLYWTGDRVRYRAEGCLEFLGRRDDQVKIRGFRVELGEVEAVLVHHPSVCNGVVLAREVGELRPGGGGYTGLWPSDLCLVAYVVWKPGIVPNTDALRRYLRGMLPDYMVPAAFVSMDSLPLTPTGKVNRGALPPPDPARRELEEAYVAPRTPIEELLAGIWTELLGVERVGVHDNFFALGGHSLLAMQVASRVWMELQVRLAVRQLFDGPTVAGLATAIAYSLAEQASREEMVRLLEELEELPEAESPSGQTGRRL